MVVDGAAEGLARLEHVVEMAEEDAPGLDVLGLEDVEHLVAEPVAVSRRWGEMHGDRGTGRQVGACRSSQHLFLGGIHGIRRADLADHSGADACLADPDRELGDEPFRDLVGAFVRHARRMRDGDVVPAAADDVQAGPAGESLEGGRVAPDVRRREVDDGPPAELGDSPSSSAAAAKSSSTRLS